MLTRLFDEMDRLCDDMGIFRIETIGEAIKCTFAGESSRAEGQGEKAKEGSEGGRL
jgi:hypothetical protein